MAREQLGAAPSASNETATKGYVDTADAAKEATANKGAANGYASLNSSGKVPTSQISLTKSDVGLGSVDNTADSAKSVATASALTTGRTIDGQTFDGTANITVIAPGTSAATAKTTPVDADVLPLVDSAASNVLKKLSWANLVATLKTYFDSVATTLSNKTIAAPIITGTAKASTGAISELYGTADQATNYSKAAWKYNGTNIELVGDYGGTATAPYISLGVLVPGQGSSPFRYIYVSPAQSPFIVMGWTATSSATKCVSVGLGTNSVSSSSATQSIFCIEPVINQSGTASYKALLINVTQTATGSGTKRLIDAQVGGTSKFYVDNTGAASVSGTAATISSGTGDPESVVTAPIGSLYTRTDGGAGTTLYVKESGTGTTGWVAK